MPLPPEPVVSPPLPVPAPGPVVVVGPGTSAQAAPEPIVVGSKQPKYLAITSGALAGSMLPLTSLPITIGRAPSNTLVIEDDYASSHHARLYPTAEGWVVEDLNSTNGTLVNGAPLTGAVLLPVGVPVSIGHSQVKLVV